MNSTIGDVQIGRRIHYPGDMANLPGDGVIVAVNEASKRFDAILFDGRRLIAMPFAMFSGLRPWHILDRMHGPAIIDMAKRKASEVEASKALQKSMAAQQLEDDKAALIAGHPHLTPAADRYDRNLVGKNIRAMLKAEGIKASVRRSGTAYYVDLLTQVSQDRRRDLVAMCDRFQGGTFDGMSDCYVYARTAWTEAFGSIDYVFVQGGRE